MKREKLINDIFQSLMLAGLVAMALPPDMAWAQTGIGTNVQNIETNISNVPRLISALFYIGGAAFMGAGALKLKMHTENPTSTKLGEGLGRLGAGAALIAIPFFANTVMGTLGLQTGSAPTISGFNPIAQ